MIKERILTVMVSWFLCGTIAFADSVKIVHWWDEYFPVGKIIYEYQGRNSLQYQDVNGDKIYNDALIWYPFDMTKPLNPMPACSQNPQSYYRYRIDRPSAQFYGGLIARFTNVSNLTETDKKGNVVPIFDHFQQATVQGQDGAALNLYDPGRPHNTGRSMWLGGERAKWADITVMVVNCCSEGLSKTFQETKKAEVNFSAIFLWKKENFVNGGGSANEITFDNTSKLSVDITRFWLNIEEGRFVVQDGEQFWISEAAIVKDEEQNVAIGKNGMSVQNLKKGAMVELNPLNSRWAIYNPSFDSEKAQQSLNDLKAANFDPKKATTTEKELYYNNSNDFYSEINKMEFNPQQAQFVSHSFSDVRAVGVYFATYQFAHETTQLVFDNFQAYAAITPSTEQPREVLAGIALDAQGQPVETDATFLREVTVNGSKTTVRSIDQLDVRGIIKIDTQHIDKEAEIIVVVGYKPISSLEEQFFMFNKDGRVLPWDGKIANLVAYEDTEVLKDSWGNTGDFYHRNILLSPERHVQIFPMLLTVFREHEEDKENILFGCAERPITYSGRLEGLIPGTLRFFFGYRLRENGTLVFAPESIDFEYQP
jgi:hypothetical protein